MKEGIIDKNIVNGGILRGVDEVGYNPVLKWNIGSWCNLPECTEEYLVIRNENLV